MQLKLMPYDPNDVENEKIEQIEQELEKGNLNIFESINSDGTRVGLFEQVIDSDTNVATFIPFELPV
jgi:hypothetical protein